MFGRRKKIPGSPPEEAPEERDEAIAEAAEEDEEDVRGGWERPQEPDGGLFGDDLPEADDPLAGLPAEPRAPEPPAMDGEEEEPESPEEGPEPRGRKARGNPFRRKRGKRGKRGKPEPEAGPGEDPEEAGGPEPGPGRKKARGFPFGPRPKRGRSEPEPADGSAAELDAEEGAAEPGGLEDLERVPDPAPAKKRGPAALAALAAKAGGGADREPMPEGKRKALFTLGCAGAGTAAAMLVLGCTVAAYRTLAPNVPAAVAAAPYQSGTAGTASRAPSGQQRIDIHITVPESGAVPSVVWVAPDGTVTAEPPADGNARPVALGQKLLDAEPADGTGQDGEDAGTELPAAEDGTVTAYAAPDGTVTASAPAEGPYRQITVKPNRDGTVSVTAGKTVGDPGTEFKPAEIYMDADGNVHSADPGPAAKDGAKPRKFSVGVGSDGGAWISEEPAGEPAEEPGKYLIVWGDTLGDLSKRFGFTVDFLAEYNGIKDKNLIIAGEWLRYPTGGG